MEYCGVNFADVYHIQGRLLQCSTPYVLGLECAGKVSEIGSDIEDLHVSSVGLVFFLNNTLYNAMVLMMRVANSLTIYTTVQ